MCVWYVTKHMQNSFVLVDSSKASGKSFERTHLYEWWLPLSPSSTDCMKHDSSWMTYRVHVPILPVLQTLKFIWNISISKTCLHTHSTNPSFNHYHSLTITPTPTHISSPASTEKLRLVLLSLPLLLLSPLLRRTVMKVNVRSTLFQVISWNTNVVVLSFFCHL